MKNLTLLAVDDDELILQSLKIGLPSHWRLIAVNKISNVPYDGEFTAAFVDMHLTGNTTRAEGMDVIKKIKENQPHLEVVAMSGDLDRDLMEQCLRAGASRYMAKPLNLEEVILTLDKIEALKAIQVASFRQARHKTPWIGNSPASDLVRRQVAQLRGEHGPILIEGESGTGKEVVTQLLHEQEGENRPFIAVNVGAIPDNLFESEIFGHVRGAFTGADQNKAGLAEAADGGDLFLDEIEVLSLPLQAKLLRFLESGEIRRVGSRDVVKLKTRVIAATNKNLELMVKNGEFREDLLWRLNSKKIVLPPLRERAEDITEIAKYFVSLDKNRKKEVASDALTALKEHSWPGNVRELKRVCEQLTLTAPLPVIRREEVLRIIQPKWVTPTNNSIDYTIGLEKLVNNYEAMAISSALKQWNDIEEVARILQISRSSLYKKLKDYNIDWKAP
jgi:DNA-binding NtrC family response regulator